ncbi:MAG: FkbM family methyltransferase [Alphaproteobacteria bacterium]|nr:FkbM family methyltransferase [Alphaproteobacteria bacterium]
MISYAQNFEDVMLWRALKHVEAGFYIDVGAGGPTLYSVTKAFYEAGWRGVNIEPMPKPFAELEAARPRDVNLRLAAGAETGTVEIWEAEVDGLATGRSDHVQRMLAEGRKGAYRATPMRRLAELCDEHAKGCIHFLKIDVEGMERDVLLGCDFARHRPWVVVVEATIPNSPVECHAEWEPLLLGAGYRMVYADGLNRFYVAPERAELADAFRYPPNFFDGFTPCAEVQANARAEWAERTRRETETRAELAEQAWRQAGAWADQLDQARLQAIARAELAETAWREADAQVKQIEESRRRAETRAELAEQARDSATARAELAEQARDAADTRAERAERARAEEAGEAAAQRLESEARRGEFEAWAHWADARAKAAEAEIAELLNSKSWRVTRPLRELRRLTASSAAAGRGAAARVALTLAGDPRVRRGIVSLAIRMGVYDRLRRAFSRIVDGDRASGDAAPPPDPVNAFDALSPRERDIHRMLEAALTPTEKP